MSSYLEWREEGHKYGCTFSESIAMILVTAITNLSCLPAIILIYRKGLIFQTYVGVFTLVTSFMYHLTESIGAEKLFMSELKWHQLDNIGAILCFIGLFIYLGNFQNPQLDLHLNFSAMMIVICLQVADPWDLTWTLAPILGYLFLVTVLVFALKTRILTNKEMTIKGAALIFIGAIFFSLSQDEHADYLRIYHGMWHLVIGYSSFYTWQSHEKEGEAIYLKEIFHKPVRKEKVFYEAFKEY